MSSLRKLQQIIFYLLVFLMPCNLAKHWPQNWSYVNGILVDYLIPTLYVTDILIIALLILWIIESIISNVKCQMSRLRRGFGGQAKLKLKSQKFSVLSYGFTFYVLSFEFIILIFSSLLATNPFAAVYKLFKLIEFFLLILWISSQGRSTFGRKTFIQVLSLSVICQSVLAIYQWFKQGSIFGYWFFGEQPYNASTLGIKMINWFGELKIPPYGTFTHPNVLAGFLVISLLLMLKTDDGKRKTDNEGRKQKKDFSMIKNPSSFFCLPFLSSIFYHLSFCLGVMALFLTFSYPAWMVWLWIMDYGLWIMIKKISKNGLKKIIYLFIHLSIYPLLIVILLFWFKSGELTSLSRRMQLSKIAIKMWLSAPLFGVGLNNFIPRMEEFGQVVTNYRFLQPVHNVFLLVLSETGIVGLIGVIWLMGKVFRDQYLVFSKRKISSFSPSILYTLYSILFLGFFDHYFLTLQSGMLMLGLVLGLILSF